MKSAKELCSLLITRGLSELTDEEEEIVVDYLENIGIEVELDDTPKQLCTSLLQKIMKDDIKRLVPITAYSNSLLKLESEKQIKSNQQKMDDRIKRKEKIRYAKLEKKLISQHGDLPGCEISDNILPMFQFIYDPILGINNGILTSVVSVPDTMYTKIFKTLSNPTLEIITIEGRTVYVRIEPSKNKNQSSNVIYMSGLVSQILNTQNTYGYVKVCKSLPYISHIEFTYLGSEDQMNDDFEYLLKVLPSIVTSFSSLSLGMILRTLKDNRDIHVIVNGLSGDNNKPIFAGLLPFGETNIPFDIHV